MNPSELLLNWHRKRHTLPRQQGFLISFQYLSEHGVLMSYSLRVFFRIASLRQSQRDFLQGLRDRHSIRCKNTELLKEHQE